jgi:Tol biopolymer transport system component
VAAFVSSAVVPIVLLSADGAVAGGVAPSNGLPLIAYTQQSSGGVSHIWTMNPDTRAPQQLTRGRYGEDAPSFSPDGRRLVYAEDRVVHMAGVSAAQIVPVIVIRDMARGSVRAITPGQQLDETPRWSPAGGRITFVRTIIPSGSEIGPPEEIWTIGTNGRAARQLTHNSVSDTAPAWSPTGRWLAYQRSRDAAATVWDLWTMRSDGSGQRLLARNGTHPAWSPNGRLIAFGQPTGEIRGCCTVTNLMVIDSSGTHRRLLVKNGGRPTWSPDGSRIVFQRINGTQLDLWVVNQDGSRLRPLTSATGDEYAPIWQPS